jgi:integrase
VSSSPLTDGQGLLRPWKRGRAFTLESGPPTPGFERLIDRHRTVCWNPRGRAPFRQEFLPHPSTNLVREREALARSASRHAATYACCTTSAGRPAPSSAPAPSRGLIVVLWRAGLRISEALALTAADLDPRRGAVLVRRGKGGRRREVFMDDWAWDSRSPG